MGQATLTTVDAILKEVYGPRIENQQEDEVVTLKRIERTSEGVVETVGGKYVDFPIRVKRNTGIGYRKENEQLQEPGQQGYAEVHVPLRYGYARAKVTGQVMDLAETNAQAFASALDEEMDRLKDDTVKDSNRVMYGDGTGLLATVTADGANTVTVDNTQYLEDGMLIDILTIADGTAIAVNREITDIDEDTGVVTYDGADVAATATEGLYRTGNFASGDSREPSGFDAIIDDTAILHNVDPATEKKWKSVIDENSGNLRALSEGRMIKMMDDIRTRGGSGAKPSVIFTGLGVRRAYFNLLVQQRRYTDTKEFAGGFTGLPFNYGKEIPVVEDVDARPNRMYFATESKIKVYRNKEWHFEEKGGGILKWVNDFDAFEALLKQYWEVGTSQRNAHGQLQDIKEG